MKRPNSILQIKDKQFSCYINNSGASYSSAKSATLYYTTPNGLNHILISVYGGEVYDKQGNQEKHLAVVDENLLNSNELKRILDFDIKEK